jgi:hypothetical protein
MCYRYYWRRPPPRAIEVLLEDAAEGDTIGWDEELNIPTVSHRPLLLVPAKGGAAGGAAKAAHAYWLVDASSSRRLYLRDWVVRLAPIASRNASHQFVVRPTAPAAGAARDGGEGGDRRSFWLIDRASGRMLYWADGVVRVAPFKREPQRAWRFRALGEGGCPHWHGVAKRRNATAREWARGVAAVARGRCDGACAESELVDAIAKRLGARRRLTPQLRAAVCAEVRGDAPPSSYGHGMLVRMQSFECLLWTLPHVS